MSRCIPWDSSIIPELRHTRKPAVLQKDRIRPLLALGNGAHCVGRSGTLRDTHTPSSAVPWLNRWPPALCPPWAMLGLGSALDNISEWTTQLSSPAFVYSTADVKQNGLWALEKEGKELPKSSLGGITLRGILAAYGLVFAVAGRTSGIVLSVWSIRHSHRRNEQCTIAV